MCPPPSARITSEILVDRFVYKVYKLHNIFSFNNISSIFRESDYTGNVLSGKRLFGKRLSGKVIIRETSVKC